MERCWQMRKERSAIVWMAATRRWLPPLGGLPTRSPFKNLRTRLIIITWQWPAVFTLTEHLHLQILVSHQQNNKIRNKRCLKLLNSIEFQLWYLSQLIRNLWRTVLGLILIMDKIENNWLSSYFGWNTLHRRNP